MITVHHLENSRSIRVLWLLEELGVDYEVKPYKRDRHTNLAPPELTALHPLGKAPIVSDGDLVLAETGAIFDYLLERYGEGRLQPAPGTPERLRYQYWMHAAEGSLMPLLVMKLFFDRIETQAPFLIRPIARGISRQVHDLYLGPGLARMLAYMEAELTGASWFAGDAFSAAGIQMGFPVDVAAARAGLDARYPRLQDFIARCRARPAHQAALQRGGAVTPLS